MIGTLFLISHPTGFKTNVDDSSAAEAVTLLSFQQAEKLAARCVLRLFVLACYTLINHNPHTHILPCRLPLPFAVTVAITVAFAVAVTVAVNVPLTLPLWLPLPLPLLLPFLLPLPLPLPLPLSLLSPSPSPSPSPLSFDIQSDWRFRVPIRNLVYDPVTS